MKIILTPFVLMLAVLSLTSCDKDIDTTTGDTVDKASYSLTIASDTGAVAKNLIGNDVDSNWDDELGLVWLGNDEENLPTGTLTINVEVSNNNYLASSILLSTADVLVGTGPEINAKLFQLSTSAIDLDDVVVGSNYISASLNNIPMVDTKTGEAFTLNGDFVAKSK